MMLRHQKLLEILEHLDGGGSTPYRMVRAGIFSLWDYLQPYLEALLDRGFVEKEEEPWGGRSGHRVVYTRTEKGEEFLRLVTA